MTLLSLITALAAPLLALNLRPTLVAPMVPTVTIAPVLPSLTLTPTLAAPALTMPAPTLTPALPMAVVPAALPVAAAKAAPLAPIAQAAAPALQAVASPALGTAGLHAAGRSLEDALTGRSSAGAVFAAPAAPVNGALPTARSAPAVPGVVYARAVSNRHKAVLEESLRRRKAGWFRALARMGAALDGPVAPKLRVTEAQDVSSKVAAVVTATAFTVTWTQGPTRSGSFKAVVPKRDPEPELRRLPDPAVPDAKLVLLRFQDKTPEADIKALLEANGLRLISRGWGENPWTAAVTGRARPASVAKTLNGAGIVLAASPKAAAFSAADQLLVAYRAGAAPAFGRHGLTVLEKTRDGLWRVGVKAGTAARARAALTDDDAVLYARPAESDAPESSQAVVTLRAADEAALKALLARRGLIVLHVMGERTYKVAGAADRAALAGDAAVESSVAVGSLPDSDVEASAKGAASYKGRPWSSTEYNLNWSMGYDSLTRRGATAAQLQRYEALCAEAPVRGGGFNPWSGD